MTRRKKQCVPKQPEQKAERQPVRVRLPGFVNSGEIGLGDAIKHVTYTVGIKPCRGCEGRTMALNRWVVFSR